MDIFDAIRYGTMDEIKEILKNKNFDINKSLGYYKTPLYIACEGGYPQKIVKLLLDNGANVNQVYKNGETQLYWACRENNLEIVKLLLECGADIDQKALDLVQNNLRSVVADIDQKALDIKRDDYKCEFEKRKAITTQILNVLEFAKQFDIYKKARVTLTLTPEEQRNENLSEFADRLAKSVRAELLDKEFRKSGSGKFSKFAKEGKGQKYFDTNIKFSN